MRLFIGAAGSGLDKLGEFSMEGKNDGDQVEVAYTVWAGNDVWKIDDSQSRQGVMGSTFFSANNQDRSYYDITSIRSGYNRLSLRAFFKGIDTGADYQQPLYIGFTEGTTLGNPASDGRVNWYIIIKRDGGNMYLLLASNYHDGDDQAWNYVYGVGTPFDGYADLSWVGVRIDYNWTTYKAVMYYDRGESGLGPEDEGDWTYLETVDISANSDVMNYVVVQTAGATNGAYDQVYIDDISLIDKTPPPTEITGVTSLDCSKRMGGNGVINAVVRDLALANYSTNKEIIWSGCEVWDNDLTRPLWEGFLVEPVFNYNWAMFQGFETLRALEKVPCNYSTILAEGEVTTVGADSIDDANASFTDALLTKPCTFTDAAGPDFETDNPNSSSNHLEDDWENGQTALTLVYERGTYADTGNPSTDYWSGWSGKAAEPNGGLELQFTVANAATSTGFEIKIVCEFGTPGDYSNSPLLKIRNDTAGTWETVIDPILSATGGTRYVTYTFKDTDLDQAISAYFDGTTLKIFIDWGEYSISERLTVYYAEVKNYYSTLFPALTVYTIDARDGDTLTFTGQSTTGISEGDRYKVGDYIHNNMTNIFAAISIQWLTLDFPTSTLFDSSDYNSAYVLDVLNSYAKMSDREVWQAIDYIVKCKATYEDSNIDLTEANVVPDKSGNWLKGSFSRNGRNIIRSARVFGAGVTYVDTQLPNYPSPRGEIYSDSRIATQAQAADIVTNILAENSSPKEILRIMINCDSAITNIENLDIGQTIDVNLYSGTINITAGLIREIHYTQTRGGNRFATLEIEVI